MARHTPESLRQALTRLTQSKGRNARETRIFRVTVTSSDGKPCSVNLRISPKKVYPTTLKQLANEMRVDVEEIDTVLENWTHEQLVIHLSRFPAEVLDSLPQQQLFLQHQKGRRST